MTTAAAPRPATAPDAPHTAIHVHPERDARDEAAEFLAAGIVAHVGFLDDGRPVVIPMTYQVDDADPRRLHLHGGHHSRLMAHLATGADVCVTVTLVDGLVYSRTALYHSVNYRSVVCFARASPRQPDAAEQRDILHAMVARYHPGRTAGVDYAPATDAHLRGTAFVTLDVDAMSAKARRGGPKGPGDDDPDAPGTAGVRAV